MVRLDRGRKRVVGFARMRDAFHFTVALFAAVAVVIVSIATTFWLHPFWSWLQRATGVESLAFHCPAEWCFFAVYGVLVAAAIVIRSRVTRRHRSRWSAPSPG